MRRAGALLAPLLPPGAATECPTWGPGGPGGALPKCSAFCTAPPNTCGACARPRGPPGIPPPPSPQPGKPNPGGSWNTTCWPNATELWAFKASAKVWGRPLLGDGVVYAGSNDGNLYAINRTTGAGLWSLATGDKIWMGPSRDPNGTLYVGSDNGYVYAVDPDTGAVVWKFRTGGWVFGTPAVGRGAGWEQVGIFAASFDRRLYALRPDGRERCHFVTGQNGSNVWASPVLSPDGETVYVGSGGIPSDGKPPPPGFRTLYAVRTADCSQRWNFTTGMWVRSSAAVAADGAVVFGSYDDHVYCLEADGSVRWSYQTGVFPGYASEHPPGFVLATPRIDETAGAVYVGATDKCFYAIDLRTGALRWRFGTFGFIHSSAAVLPGGEVAFGGNDGNVYSLYANGTVRWVWQLSGWVQSSPAVGDDGTVYIGDANGFVHALR